MTQTDNNPFDLDAVQAYGAWRERKLANYPVSLDELVVPVENPRALTDVERAAILQACGRANMAVYTLAHSGEAMDKTLLAGLGAQFGLRDLDCHLYTDDDGISALQVSAQRRQYEYIPYSNHAISWHTDGYYNPPQHRVLGMVLHCVRPAAQGGENRLLDHEIAYIRLRDENPRHIAALMQADVMTIPANVEEGIEIRPLQSGPVFSVDAQSGKLHMRYTARTRSIDWKQDADTQAAVRALEAVLAEDLPQSFRHRLAAGQGVICNNVLHTRSAFEDDAPAGQGRLMYRARFYQRVGPLRPGKSIIERNNK
ncbi:MAG TPA: taurine catabolism dioxygenase TauD [Chromatiales bacterium]|nr:taurine catabolism dioxygenase TauD [Chromatiales bacterium]HEX21886.1 taurine catabolism dioxygenase TauD [Chromatiales bacterium]